MGQPPVGTDGGAVAVALHRAGCVFAEEEARLLLSAVSTDDELAALVSRRIAGEPLEQILGWVDFCGCRIALAPGVFTPRRRTELLVRQAVGLGWSGCCLVDLCCGSGAVGVAIAALLDRVDLHAVDIDAVAVACARRNVADISGSVYCGDLYDPLPEILRGRVDLLVGNAPYVPTASIPFLPGEARLHEPRVALDGGAEGLDVARRLIAEAPNWLAPGGYLLIESGSSQAMAAAAACRSAGLLPSIVSAHDDEATVIVGAKPATE